MSVLNNFFEKIYCINLDRRPDRWILCQEEFEKWGIKNVERVSAIDGKKLNMKNYNSNLLPGELGIILTNLKIINKLEKEGINTALILEDDVVFDGKIDEISIYLEKIPKDWDMIYFGGNHNTHVGVEKPKFIDDGIYKIHNTYAAHCVGLKKSIYGEIKKLSKSYKKQIDVIYTEIQKKGNTYCIIPAVAHQRIGFSDIQNRVVDYKDLIK